jgi:hypothetical protein
VSAVIATPELIANAAADVATIGSTLNAAHVTAVPPTQALLPAAADEVSAGIAHLFSGYASEYHELAARAAGYQRQFVQHLAAAADSYAGAEDVNALLLRATLSGPVAAALPSPDQIIAALIDALTPLFFQTLSALYYLLFLLLVPIYGALALYLPFAFLGSLFAV